VIYQLLGAPDTNKQDIAEKLRAYLNEGYDIVQDLALDYPNGDFGFLADYREELLLAVHRATRSVKDQDLILTHSLIDSVGYAGLKVKDLLEQDDTNPDVIRWGATFNVILQMLMDGFKVDHLLYIPYEGDDSNSIDLDAALVDILDTLDMDYTEIDPSEEAAKWISI
jgi:hypothetical protein